MEFQAVLHSLLPKEVIQVLTRRVELQAVPHSLRSKGASAYYRLLCIRVLICFHHKEMNYFSLLQLTSAYFILLRLTSAYFGLL